MGHKWLCERAILAPKNNSVSVINLYIQEQLRESTTVYKSIDTVDDVDESVQYPIESLNSLEPSGMRLYNLLIKVGSSIIFFWNLDAPRLCVEIPMSHVIEATILTGCAKDEDVSLSRIPMIPSDMPFEFRCLQLPV
jgi:ATP-dependent DNA helicase PIF1